MTIDVADAPAAHRYEAHVEGELAGYIQYRDRSGSVDMLHTEVLQAFEGKGVGSVLVRRALDDVRSRGLTIVPTCPFVTSYIRRHQEYVDVVEPHYRARVVADP